MLWSGALYERRRKSGALAMPIIHSHPLVDGTKRTGFAAADLFLSLNGYQFIVDQVQVETIPPDDFTETT
jgi:prophage maintenance system killer protein